MLRWYSLAYHMLFWGSCNFFPYIWCWLWRVCT